MDTTTTISTQGTDREMENYTNLQNAIKALRDENYALAKEGREASERFGDRINARVDALRTEITSKVEDVRLELSDKLDGNTKTLADHVTSDTLNFEKLNVAVASAAAVSSTKDSVKKEGRSNIAIWVGLVLSNIVAIGTAIILALHK